MTQDEIEQAIAKVTKAVSEFEEAPSPATAVEAEWKLTIFKLLVGLDKFDSLPAFKRALDAVEDYLENEAKKDAR